MLLLNIEVDVVIRVNQMYYLHIKNKIWYVVYFSKYTEKRFEQTRYDIQISVGEMFIFFYLNIIALRFYYLNILKLFYRP